MRNFSGIIKAFEKAASSFFDDLKISKENQTQTQMIKDKKRLKKASNIAEEIFLITDENKYLFDKETKRQYEKLRKEFDKKD